MDRDDSINTNHQQFKRWKKFKNVHAYTNTWIEPLRIGQFRWDYAIDRAKCSL